MRIEKIEKLNAALEEKIKATFTKNKQIGRLTALKIIFQNPVISIGLLAHECAISYNTAHKILNDFKSLGIVTAAADYKRNKHFVFNEYIALLNAQE